VPIDYRLVQRHILIDILTEYLVKISFDALPESLLVFFFRPMDSTRSKMVRNFHDPLPSAEGTTYKVFRTFT
jgi:hypothetical protein